MIDNLNLKLRILRYLEKHPNAWTRDAAGDGRIRGRHHLRQTHQQKFEMVITTEIKAVPGDRVMVENYRTKNKDWELGEVRNTSIGVDKNGIPKVSYHVWVTRQPTHPRGRYGYYLAVGDAQIDQLRHFYEHE